VKVVFLVKLAYISCLGGRNLQSVKRGCDFPGKSSGAGMGQKIATVSAFAAPFLGAEVPLGGGSGIYFGFVAKKVSAKHLYTPFDSYYDKYIIYMGSTQAQVSAQPAVDRLPIAISPAG